MKNYYSKLVGKIKNRILPSKESVLGIDVGAGYLKVVELSLVEENTIKAVAINSLDKSIFDEEGIADINLLSQILRRTIEVNGISAKHAVLSLGGRALFAREILFPKMTETELTEAIKWEIEKYVPYEPEKYFYDYNVIGEAENGKEIRVMLVAAPKGNVENLVSLVKSAGLKPFIIDGETFALSRTIGVEDYICVDIGKVNTQVIIYQDGVPITNRNIPLFGDSFTKAIAQVLDLDYVEAESFKQRQKNLVTVLGQVEAVTPVQEKLNEMVDELGREILRTIEYFQIQKREAVFEKIIISGGGARLDGLVNRLATEIRIPVEMHQPLQNLQWIKSFDKQYLQSVAPQLAIAVGLALRGGEE